MSESTAPYPSRPPEGGRPPRPRDAATLVLYRRRRRRIEVLMGERHGDHAFLPNRCVFPGGGVDRGDGRVRVASPPADDVARRLARSCAPTRARALAAAAVRETFEETGLVVGGPDPCPGGPVPAGWRPFFARGVAPSLGDLDYIARAITPTFRPIRFDARFFMVDAAHAAGALRGSGELLKLGWVPTRDAVKLEIPLVTGVVLRLVEDLLTAVDPPLPDRPVPVFGIRRGKRVVVEE